MTADEEWESELTEISTTLKAEMARGKKKMKKTGRTGSAKEKWRLLSWLSQGQHPVTGAECGNTTVHAPN